MEFYVASNNTVEVQYLVVKEMFITSVVNKIL